MALAVTEAMVMAGAKALHEDWRKAFLPGGKWADYAPAIKRERLFAWENLHPQNHGHYINASRTVLGGAAELMSQSGYDNQSQVKETHPGARPDNGGKR